MLARAGSDFKSVLLSILDYLLVAFGGIIMNRSQLGSIYLPGEGGDGLILRREIGLRGCAVHERRLWLPVD